MISLEQIEEDLKQALKSREQLTADTLRGLKVRMQNEKIAKMKDLAEEDMIALVKSEIKRRKEAVESFTNGNRPEMAAKEQKEITILEKYLPAQMSEQEISAVIDAMLSENSFSATDFGKAMGLLKSRIGQAADGGLMAKLLKEKLK